MQISINKMQDASNPENSLLKKFDDFYKDNKNIENEMYFYRVPRVDKVYYQAEIQNEENFVKDKNKKVGGSNSHFDLNNDDKNFKDENGKGSENNIEDYFDNITENGEYYKEKNYYEENEKKKIKNSKYAKTEVNEASMPIIDLEDANMRMDLEEKGEDEVKDKDQLNRKEMQKENILKSYDELDRENNYLNNYTYAQSILGDHNQVNQKSYKNLCKKRFDYSKINKEDLNYYMKFIDFYKNSQDFGNVILKGSQDFELLALELLRDCNYSISMALKQILYPIVDYLEEDESERDFDVPYNNYQNNNNAFISCNNNLSSFAKYNLKNLSGFESANELRHYSNDFTNNLGNNLNLTCNYYNYNNNYQKHSQSIKNLSSNNHIIKNNNESYSFSNTNNYNNYNNHLNTSNLNNNINTFLNQNQLESLGTQSPKSSSRQHNPLNSKSKQDADLYVNSALNDLIGSNMHEKTQWYEHVKKRLRQNISAQELQDLIGIAKKMKIDIPDFVLEENEKCFAFAKKIRKHLNLTPNSAANISLSDRNSLSDMARLLEDSNAYKVKYDEFGLLEEAIKKANSWRSRASEIESECVNYKILQNLYNEGKNLPIKLENFEQVKLRFLSAQQWQEKYAALPKHSKTRNNNCSQERCKMSHLYTLIEEAEKINFTSSEVISLKTNFEKLREYEERIYLSFEDSLLFNFDNKDSLQEFINMLDTLKFTTETYDAIAAKISLLNWRENKEYYLASKSLKMKHLRNLLKDAAQKNLNSLAEIKIFSNQIAQMESWLESISNVFYKEAKPEADKIELSPLQDLYRKGKQFKLKPEEIEHLLVKSEEVIDFVKECEEALLESSSFEGKENKEELRSKEIKFDFERLLEIKDKIEKLNVRCDVFGKVEERISAVFEWIEKYKQFRKMIDIMNFKENEIANKENSSLNNGTGNVSLNKNQESGFSGSGFDKNVDFAIKNNNNNFNETSSKNKRDATYSNVKNSNNNNNLMSISKNTLFNTDAYFYSFNLRDLFGKFERDREKLNLENRHKMIELLQEYVNKNKCFYEDLMLLIESAPQYVKSGTEFLDLQKIKHKSEEFMNKFCFTDSSLNEKNMSSSEKINLDCKIDKNGSNYSDVEMNFESSAGENNNNFNNLSDFTSINSNKNNDKFFLNNSTFISQIKEILCDSQNYCISRNCINGLFLLFKSESWVQIATTDEKMNLSDAEAMLKEANSLYLEKEKLNSIKNQVQITKDWIKNYKKFFNLENLDYEKIKNTLAEGEKLPLISDEINELQEFLHTLESDIRVSRAYIKIKDFDFDEFKKFVEKIRQYYVFIPEFKILEAMKDYAQEWKIIANRILQCRKLCTLYFRTRQGNINNNDLSSGNNLLSHSGNLDAHTNNNLNEQVFLNPIEINTNISESNFPNNIEIYTEDLISNKNKSSSILSFSKKKRNRASSNYCNPINNTNNNPTNSLNNINLSLGSNRDSVSNLSEDVRSNLNNKNSNKGKYKKRTIDEKSNGSFNYIGNFNATNNNHESNFDNDFSKDLENIDSGFINGNKINRGNSNKKNTKANKKNLLGNETTNISDIRDTSNLPSDIFGKSKKNKKYKDATNLSNINDSNVFEQPDFSSNNYSNKKMKKAEKLQYENVLSVINSMPIKDKNNNYTNFNFGIGNAFRKTQDSQSKSLGINPGEDINLNLEESCSILNSINNNPNQAIDRTSKKPTHIENISAKKFQTLCYLDQLDLISCSFDLKDENPSEKYCICRRGDDSLNFMIMCENCKEWFHGICMHITKQFSSKIASYLCLGCSKRKEVSTAGYHGEFLNNKRVEYSKFLEFLEEYEYVSPHIPEYGILVGIKEKMEAWFFNYKNLLKQLLEFCKGNLILLTQQINANFISLSDKNLKVTDLKEDFGEKEDQNENESEKAKIKTEAKIENHQENQEIDNQEVKGEENIPYKNDENEKENNLQTENEKAIEEFEIPEQNFIQINNVNKSNINIISIEKLKSENREVVEREHTDANKNKDKNKILLNKSNDYEINDNQDIRNEFDNNFNSSIIFTTKIKNFLLSEALEKQIMDLYLESEGFPIDVQVGYNLILILKYQDWLKDAYKCIENKKFSEKLYKRVLTNYKMFETNQTFIAESDVEREFYNFVFPIAHNFYEKSFQKYVEHGTQRDIIPNKEKAEIIEQLNNNLVESNPTMQHLPEYKKTQFIRYQVSTYYKLKEQLKMILDEDITYEAFKQIYDQMHNLNFRNKFIIDLKNLLKNFNSKGYKEIKGLLFDETNTKKKVVFEKLENSEIKIEHENMKLNENGKENNDLNNFNINLNIENNNSKKTNSNKKHKNIDKEAKNYKKINNSESDVIEIKQEEQEYKMLLDDQIDYSNIKKQDSFEIKIEEKSKPIDNLSLEIKQDDAEVENNDLSLNENASNSNDV